MLTVSQLSKSFAGRALFGDVSLQVNRGDRIGLVGPKMGLANQRLEGRDDWISSAGNRLSSSRNAVSFRRR
jgi:ABC-type phosphonate transport system ATPase subunit